MKLGDMIALLERKDFDKEVEFDFGYFAPTVLDSYRGYYDQLALGYQEGGIKPTVETLLVVLKEAVGKEYIGYKGGEFIMDEDTDVWVANYGECPSVAIESIEDLSFFVVIRTKKYEL